MKSFKRSLGLALIGAVAILAGLANLPTPATAATIAPAAICDEVFCKEFDSARTDTDAFGEKVDSAFAIALSAQPAHETPAGGSEISAVAMIALGAVLMTSRVRRKGLWALRAPWRSLAGQPG